MGVLGWPSASPWAYPLGWRLASPSGWRSGFAVGVFVGLGIVPLQLPPLHMSLIVDALSSSQSVPS